MKKIVIAISAFVMYFTLPVSAQTVTVHTPDFKTGEKKYDESQNKVYNNNIKANVALLPRGVFMINYERGLTDYFTIQGGVGINHRDYLHGTDFDAFLWGDESAMDYVDWNITMGYSYELMARFYPKQRDDFDGVYLAPLYRHRHYNAMVTPSADANAVIGASYGNDDYILTDDEVDMGLTVNEYSLLLGWQAESWVSEVLFDFYLGIGYRVQEGGVLKTDGYESNKNLLRYQKDKKSRPFITCGFSIGFAF